VTLSRTLIYCPPARQDNLIHGRFLAELTKEVFVDLEASKYQHTGGWVAGWVVCVLRCVVG
jgi:hypothetical protein